jgi:hypothetical protein
MLAHSWHRSVMTLKDRNGSDGRRFASLYIGYPDAHFEAVGEDIILGNRGCSEWIFSGTKAADGTKVLARH